MIEQLARIDVKYGSLQKQLLVFFYAAQWAARTQVQNYAAKIQQSLDNPRLPVLQIFVSRAHGALRAAVKADLAGTLHQDLAAQPMTDSEVREWYAEQCQVVIDLASCPNYRSGPISNQIAQEKIAIRSEFLTHIKPLVETA